MAAKTHASESLFEHIRDDLMKRILSGEMHPGEKLPSERALAVRYAVSRLTVRQAIDQLIYRNLVHRRPPRGTFVTERSQNAEGDFFRGACIALIVVPDFSVSIFPSIAAGITRNAPGTDFSVVLRCCDENRYRERQYLEELRERNVQGIILVAGVTTIHNLDLLKELTETMPFVMVDIQPPGLQVDRVYSDDSEGARQAVSHLIELGHRRILHLAGPQEHSTAKSRLEGYKLALAEHDLPYDPSLVRESGWGGRGAYAELKKAFLNGSQQHVTAIFACDDQAAVSACRVCREFNLNVPRDISVVGYGNLDTGVPAEVALTSVDQHPEIIGEEALSLLVEKIQGKRPMGTTAAREVAPTLVTRNSCGIQLDQSELTRN